MNQSLTQTEFGLGTAFFVVCATLAVAGALGTVMAPNPIRGAMGLLLMIVSIAGLFVALQAQFLAAIQLIVYAGAVVVLFLFVIMLLGPSAVSSGDHRGKIPRTISGVLFGACGAGILFLLWKSMPLGKNYIVRPSDLGSVEQFGKILFTDALVPFELSSALLIVAVVGAIAVAKGSQGENRKKTEAAS